ncbi:MAG TPA: polymer-forming cytoskeletal protein [Candidatus Limnocylindria bacterium]|nr:polymer-forming cytoskeletal protein [Candidatus Limnocylindria bacterium]
MSLHPGAALDSANTDFRSRAAALLAALTPTSAHAEEVLEFKPVPAESATQMERRAAERARAAERTRRQAADPADPAEPAIPEPPSPPDPDVDINLGRSGDIMRIGSDITIEKDQVVDGDVVAMGGNVEVLGRVRGDVAAMGGNLHLASTAIVGGDVVCIGGKLDEEAGASVGGQRVTALTKMKGRHREAIAAHADVDRGPDFGRVASAVIMLLILLGIAWAYVAFAPARTATMLDTIRREAGMSLMVGFVTAVMLVPSLVALALVMAILCITIIGIPLAIAALFLWFGLIAVLVSWGFVGGATWFGERFSSRFASSSSGLVRSAITGVLAIQGLCVVGAIIHLVPWFGWLGGLLRFISLLAGSLAVLVGAGALMRSKLGQGPEGQWWPLKRRVRPTPPVSPAAGLAMETGPPPAPPPGPAQATPPPTHGA